MSPPDVARGASAELAALLDESAEDLYENAPCGYVSTTTDGTVVRINSTLLGWLGYEREEVVDRLRIHDLLAPGDRIFYETHSAPLLAMQGMVREIAVEVVAADGTRMPALMNSVLRRGDMEGASVIRTTLHDARDRRRYEQELLRARRDAEARARAAAALDHVYDGVLVLDRDGRVTVFNPAAERILGLSEAGLGQPIRDAVDWWARLADRIPVGTLDAPPRRATLPVGRPGRERWLSVCGIDAGEATVYTIRDVTADRSLEGMRDELISVLSHELRTPLAAAYGAAQTLLGRELPAEQRQVMLETVVGQAERLTRIIDQVVLARRVDTGELELGDGSFDAGEVALATAAEVGRALRAGERLRVSTPDAPLLAAGDPAHARQALASLLENALKYSPEDSPVDVGVVRTAGRARISVEDRGPGIPPAERERIFERFHRLDPDLAGGVGGIGLGLYVARGLVERMDGRLTLEPGESGATFVIDLPLAPAPPALDPR